MAREYFRVFHSYLEAIEPFTDEEIGRLFKALLHYSITGEAPVLTGNERFIFPSMKSAIDRDMESYQEKVAANRINGLKGGRPKKPKETEKTHMVSEKPNETEKSQDRIQNTEDRIQNTEECIKRNAKRFTPPTQDEVSMYVREKGLSVDPVQFYEYFTEGNWKDAKGNPVRNWKQKILTWEKFQPVKAKPKVVSFADLTWDDEEVIYDP